MGRLIYELRDGVLGSIDSVARWLACRIGTAVSSALARILASEWALRDSLQYLIDIQEGQPLGCVWGIRAHVFNI